MKARYRRSPLLLGVGLLVLGSATGVAAQIGVGDFIVQWGNGHVEVAQSGVIGEGDVQIAAQTLEFVPGVAAALPDLATPDATDTPVRAGLTFNEAELAVWRDRSVNGPFKSKGDAWENSPGDWDRLLKNSERFLAAPDFERYAGPRTDGSCVQRFDDGPNYTGPGWLRDAAFVTLVTGDDKYQAAVRQELLWHARQGGLDFANANVWCEGVLKDIVPGFEVASMMTTFLYAYDYLGDGAFTAGEVERLDAWFHDAGRYFQAELDNELINKFEVRSLTRHVVRASVLSSPFCNKVNWVGGPSNCHLQRVYNNRHATMARLVTAVGVHRDDASMRRSGKMFAIEFLKYSVFPDGTFGELERWRDDLPDLGWGYASQTVGPVIMMADLLARDGDTSLYDFRTSEGALGTEGGEKSVLFAAQALGRYVDGTYQRHGTDDAADVGPDTLIDGEHVNWHAIFDIMVTPANRYYDDAYLKQVYERSGPGMRQYPSAVAGNGPNAVWSGEHGTLPAIMFMYAGLEDLPY